MFYPVTTNFQNPVHAAGNEQRFCCVQLIELFNSCFRTTEKTLLQGGAIEPFYQPASEYSEAKVIFTRDYFASALHEISHWCIAGIERRKLADYGYWYAPDGRTHEQQALFEAVEIKPQALEWLFNRACGHRFSVSADNVTAGLGASGEFKCNIVEQAKKYCTEGVNTRALTFMQALSDDYGIQGYLDLDNYTLEAL